MKYRTLTDFVNSISRNEYIRDFGLISYYRKQHVFFEGVAFYVLCRANTQNRLRAKNVEIKKNPKSTGKYRALDNLTFELSKNYGFHGTYVECVFNPFLYTKLPEYGYTAIPNLTVHGDIVSLNFIKLNAAGQSLIQTKKLADFS